MQPPFTARSIERLRDVDPGTGRLATSTGSAPSGEAELIEDFAYPLPVEVFCDMLGIPAEQGPSFRSWTAAVARSLDLVISEEDYDACMVLLDEMQQYLSDAADAKRAAPGRRLLSALLTAEVDGERLTHNELVPQLITLYVAGHEPTTALDRQRPRRALLPTRPAGRAAGRPVAAWPTRCTSCSASTDRTSSCAASPPPR